MMDLEGVISRGEFRKVANELRCQISAEKTDVRRKALEWELEKIRRLRLDYSLNERRLRKEIKKKIGDFSEREFRNWLSSGAIDYITIDGRPRFFNRAAENLIFARPELKSRMGKNDTRLKHLLAERIIAISMGDVKKYRIRAGIKVRIRKNVQGPFRVWLPFPREGYQVEKVKLIRAKPGEYFISDAPQRTIYFESSEREFYVEFEYIISEVAGGVEGEAPDKYLSERYPHIVFSPFIRDLAKEIGEGADSQLGKAKRIYDWVTKNMHYFYVRNYGTYRNIGEYAALHLRGDCGFHAILFIAMCRAVGIPAKWQSGWFITPYYSGPHDWAQVYADGKWYPVDASFGNLNRHGKVENDFYFGNLDAFRMVANDDLLSDFDPKKQYFRSDPVDNQVGEVENSKGNVYYDGFSWKAAIKNIEVIKSF